MKNVFAIEQEPKFFRRDNQIWREEDAQHWGGDGGRRGKASTGNGLEQGGDLTMTS